MCKPAAVLLAIAVLAVMRPPVLFDFAAFACAGRAMLEHGNPYDHVGALAACETGIVALTGAHLPAGEILPAPFPPYALAIFAVFGILPPSIGASIWMLLLVGSYVAVVAMLRKLTAASPLLIVAATVVPIFWASIEVAQVVPMVLASILGAAAANRAGRPLTASLLATLAMIEPHLGLPACLALFCSNRATRPPLCLGAGALALLSCSVMPPTLVLHYLRDVLPSHARAELSADSQMSLAHALHMLGVPDGAALGAGGLQYLAMLGCGVLLARRFAARGTRDLAVLTAPTLAVMGGSFVHIHQLGIVSCCLLLLLREQPERRVAYDLALVFTAAPLIVARSQADALLYILIAALIAYMRGYRPLTIAAFAAAMGLAISAAYTLMLGRIGRLIPLREADFVPRYDYGALASIEATWQAFVSARFTWLGPVSLLIALPAYLALAVTAVLLVRIAYSNSYRSESVCR